MVWQTILKYEENDTLDVLVEDGFPTRVRQLDTEESPGLDDFSIRREIYLSTGLVLNLGEWSEAEEGHTVAPLSSFTLDSKVVNAVIDKAKEAASSFYSEFRDTLDPAKTDWDAVAWGEDRRIVEETDETADPDDYSDIYLFVLEWEVLRHWRQEIRCELP